MLKKRFIFNFIIFIIFLLWEVEVLALSLQYDIRGVNDDILQNIQARLTADQASTSLSLSVINQRYKSSLNEIRLAIQPYGYLNPVIHSQLSHHQGFWTAHYQISLGQPILIAKTDIRIMGEGESNLKLIKLRQQFPLKVGDVFDSTIYTKAKDNLFEVANEEGYLSAVSSDNKIIINPKTRKAIIILYINTGPRFYFGNTTFINRQFSQTFLTRFNTLHEGAPYSSEKILLLQQAMEGSPYFKQVSITPQFSNAKNHQVPLQVTVIPPKSQRYNLGLGYGTFTHARISAGVSFKNLTSTGHHFDAQLRLSSVISGLSAKYYIPGHNPLTDQWVIGSNVELFTPKNVSSRSTSVFAGYETKLREVKTSLDLNYLVERYRIDPMPVKISQILYPKLNLYYVKADNLINPRSGRSFDFTLQGSSQQFLSKTSFAQAEIKSKFVFSPFSFSRFIIRGDLGYSVIKDIDNLPATLLFYAGELNGLRGFPDASVGPGRYLVIGSAEYQHKVLENWYGAIFYDVGKASDHLNDTLNKSDGVGVVYQSVIGPIKLYIAHAINTKTKPYSIEFNIGPEF